jgi:8-oxo-dGTP pyrophosphatase MutT (NUDIX family)
MSDECPGLDPKIVTVKAFCLRNRAIFLIHDPTRDRWDTPGGRAHPGEDLHAALRREIHEELSVEPTAMSAAPVWAWSGVTKRHGHYVIGIAYAVELPLDQIAHSAEHDTHGWFEAEAIAALAVPNVHQPAYLAYLRELPAP